MEIIKTETVKKVYTIGDIEVRALRSISFSIERGEFVAIMGPSVSGKSTLMNILGCLDSPTGGSYFLEGVDVSNLNNAKLAETRNQKIGCVFQSFNLLPKTTAFENVELPMIYDRSGRVEDPLRAAVMALEKVSLSQNGYPITRASSQGARSSVLPSHGRSLTSHRSFSRTSRRETSIHIPPSKSSRSSSSSTDSGSPS